MARLHLLVCMLGITFVVADYSRYAEFIEQQAANETFVRLFQQHLTNFQDDGKNLKASQTFTCKPFPQPSGSKPTSVHKLRPMDVNVIGAVGDSITAGTGITALTVLGLLTENRGLSWSVGGKSSIDKEQTLPNILKVYNPDIKGYSVASGPVWLESSSRLNVANPGDTSVDMPGQAKLIVERMKADKNINFDEDWKVITMFIGGNDLCSFCGSEKEKYSAENYVAHIQEALDYLHDNVPRAFVNFVSILDIFIVKRLNENLVCNTLHYFLCDCAAFPANSEAEAELQAETEKYRSLMEDLVLSGRYDTRDDFTVVIQPFFSETHPPTKDGNSNDPDLSYFAPDCFHLSKKGHQSASDALWNNMIEPVGKKRTKWTPGEAVECPSAQSPYFYTYKNSGTSDDLGSEPELPQDFQAPQGLQVDSDANPDSTKPGMSAASHLAIGIVGAVAGVLVLVALIGAVLWKRNHSNKEERQILLQSTIKPSYVQI